MKMEQTECSETSAYKIQTPGNYPKESIQHTEHGKSLKLRTCILPQFSPRFCHKTAQGKEIIFYFIPILIWEETEMLWKNKLHKIQISNSMWIICVCNINTYFTPAYFIKTNWVFAFVCVCMNFHMSTCAFLSASCNIHKTNHMCVLVFYITVKSFLLSLTGTCTATTPQPQQWNTKQKIQHPVINNLLIDI